MLVEDRVIFRKKKGEPHQHHHYNARYSTPHYISIKKQSKSDKEDDPLKDLDGKILQGVHAFCFCGDMLVVVYAENKKYWSPPGGAIESGETYEEAVVREVREETNMKVIKQHLIGYQDIYEPNRIIRQTRSVCIVEPIGEFTVDPDGEITEIKLIDPKEYKKYFDWGVVGDRIMEQALRSQAS